MKKVIDRNEKKNSFERKIQQKKLNKRNQDPIISI